MVGDVADIDKHNRDAERFLKRASGTVIVVLLEYFLAFIFRVFCLWGVKMPNFMEFLHILQF